MPFQCEYDQPEGPQKSIRGRDIALRFSFSSLPSIGEYKAKIKGLNGGHPMTLPETSTGSKELALGHCFARKFAAGRNFERSADVIYSNPRYDGGRFTLSPQERPPFLLRPMLTHRIFLQTVVCSGSARLNRVRSRPASFLSFRVLWRRGLRQRQQLRSKCPREFLLREPSGEPSP